MTGAIMQVSNASVLLLAPAGRDGAVAAAILSEVGVSSRICGGVEELVTLLDGASCAVVSEEGLLNANRRSLREWIAQQPPWSDFPFVVLTSRGSKPDERLPGILGNVTVLERPFHPAVLVNAVRSALRARTRQREVEAHLQERQRTHERQSLLIRELHHRVKNTLATVQALLGATARSATSIEEFYQSFASRVVALGRTHTLLTEDYWQAVSVRDMLATELGP